MPSVVVSYKKAPSPGPVTSLPWRVLEDRGVDAVKDLSAIVPNLHIPDYGTAMTSSIYLRGFGSRIDNPVLGLYIDDIPVLDKNAYDFEWLDVSRAELLRGPQGTLYGRNAMCGVLSLTTPSPSEWQGVKATAEYGSFGTFSMRASLSRGNASGGLAYKHRSGYYRNSFDDSPADRSDALQARFRWGRLLRDGSRLENLFTGNATLQKGYPYRQSIEGELLPVCYNHDAGYRRLSLTDGVKYQTVTPHFRLRSISSVQLLWDRMDMDQDFTPRSVFTLRQIRRQGALTQEVILHPRQRPQWWDSVTGAFGMFRLEGMSAPVQFLSDGIDDLILGNANAHIPEDLGHLEFDERSFPILSDFLIFTGNAAVYHESWFTVGRWQFTAGLRLGLEGGWMRYDSEATVHYAFVPIMMASKAFTTSYKGGIGNLYPEILPKVSIRYGTASSHLAAGVSKGSKAGGFNTQLFSDILQNKMMNGLMEDLGVYLDAPGSAAAENTTYKDEACWNFELTGLLSRQWGKHRVRIEATAFDIEAVRQQLTVFPPGKATGRMMTNAGRSRSFGAEASFDWRVAGWSLSASYGFTEARFVRFNDGHNDYAGKRIPYAPRHTVNAYGSYYLDFHRKDFKGLRISLSYRGTGDIMWNESNTLRQPYYSLLGAGITLVVRRAELYVRGENLLGAEPRLFYFRSMENDFFQTSRPLALYGGIRIRL